MYQTIVEEAWGLVHSLATQCINPQGLGTMSPAPYDTAWVAMTEKRDMNGDLKPLFPEAYDYLRRTQSKDGSWAAETSTADGIINTLAALLALRKQQRGNEAMQADNDWRCRAAEASLRRLLNAWDLESTDRVGMEILVPSLLKLLEAEGISFNFPCKKLLMALNEAKLARLGPVLTSPVQTTLIHTLEAFVGTLNFDRVKQHKMPNGSMLASPSSTAAYLMNASEWDDEAEAYLRRVMEQSSSIGERGGFPSAFPSTIFEVSWVLDLFLESGFHKDDFLLADMRNLTILLEKNLDQHKGILGWAPSCLPDADDTAKAISVLRLLGWNKDVEPMLKAFETDTSFITYRGERNASSSANCNILLCLLRTPEPSKYTQQIVKCASFLSKTWMRNNGPDKWHTSVQYPMMLIAQAFVLLLKHWAKGELDTDACPKKLMYQDVPRTLLDILGRTMRLQEADGSWESKREVTAYAVLALGPLLSLPWVDFLKPEGIACMYRGKAYLENNRHRWREAEKVWIEKTVYGSPNLSQAYCLAASKIVVPTAFVSAKVSDIYPAQLAKKIAKMSGFFSQVVPFSQAPKWKLQLSLLQSASYSAALKGERYSIFPPMEKASDEKYQEYIPFTWIGCRDFLSTGISAETLWEMMRVSMFNFQVDAYMETAVWEQYRNRLPELKAFIRALCNGKPQKRKRVNEDGKEQQHKKQFGPKSVSKPYGSSNGAADSNGVVNGASNGTAKVDPGEAASQAVNGHVLQKNGSTQQASNGFTNGVHKRVDSAVSYEMNEDTDSGKPNGAEDPVSNGDINTSNEPELLGERFSQGNGKIEVGGSANSTKAIPANGANDIVNNLENHGDVKEVLTKFVNFALQHPKVLQSPASLRVWLAHELQTFLLAHITHMEDCETLPDSLDASTGTATWAEPRTTYFNWVRTTSADHTSCPYSFVFFLCLIGESGQFIISNLHQRYALEDACRHLATMCRQYNDLGSVVRDQEERNLNSVNFPEFDAGNVNKAGSKKSLIDGRKRDLLAVAEYERRCLDRVIGELEPSLDKGVMEKLKLFIQVTDLYGQIYVVRDIGIRRMEENKQT